MSAAAPGERAGGLVPPLLMAMRPYQWPKNVVVFAAFVFSAGEAWTPGDPESWWPLLWRSLVLFGLWCLAASATYLLNDVRDREADRLHPRKRLRPIASGRLRTGTALGAAAVLAVVSIPAAIVLDRVAGLVLAGYVVLMALYSLQLKRVAILDILLLGAGVVGRAVSGAAAIEVDISPWLYVCSSFAAFFVATTKRWAEFRQLGPEAAKHRPSLAAYNAEVLELMLGVSAAGALLSYSLYTIESARVPADGSMALTIPFVAFGLFRFLLLMSGPRQAEAPDRVLFTDPQVLLAVAGFTATALAVLVAHR
ncbi:UbiA prenyltransferase family protein [Tepidiforma sp.]|uniref:UbiA prenyltransferase family protein n=1 Tax=Tepidiforma sp. TaxID=2682230 RepID=UPI0026127320|nr:UbiA prenyltransferase family protein [Tepidiforma sp.]MCX7616467.1 UbiA prenyltransferase family protein [Tepidiforma sp.]